jgi:hypothetical protein
MEDIAGRILNKCLGKNIKEDRTSKGRILKGNALQKRLKKLGYETDDTDWDRKEKEE